MVIRYWRIIPELLVIKVMSDGWSLGESV